jgi:signal transduction histidine kinase
MEHRWDLRPFRRAARPSQLDVILALALAAVSGAPREKAGLHTAAQVVLVVAGSLPVVLRRVFPIPVLAVLEVVLVLEVFVLGTDQRAVGLGTALAMYTVARSHDRGTSLRIALVAAGLNSVSVGLAALVGRPGSLLDVIPHVIVIAGSWGIGDNIRTRRAYLASLHERAERAEREREENARRAVLEERARIARELHDVVAHHVSAIAVTAGAAEETAVQQPERARDVLRAIQATSRQALSEMRALVGVLDGGDTHVAELGPQPGLADIDRLLAQSRAAGLQVALSIEGSLHALPEALDVTAYRIVQEALTNAIKHAPASHVQVTVRYGDDALELVVRNDGSGAAESGLVEDGGGRGLVGMRERVSLFRGELSAGRDPAGGYRVVARLPLGGLSA